MKNHCLKDFITYSVSNVMGMIGISCYILADTYFVANGLGSNGLAALNLAIPLYSLMRGAGLMIGMGGATRYTILKSQGKQEESNQIFTHCMAILAGLSVLFLLATTFFANEMTSLMGADQDTFAMCKTYLQTLWFFSPAFLFNEAMLCFVRNDGAPKLAMTGMLVGSFANIVLDYLFIFPCKMGIFGAVLATGFSPVISLLIMSSYFIRKKNKFHFTKLVPKASICKIIAAGGVPSMVAECSSGFVILIFNVIMLNLSGNVGVAAYGVIANIALVVLAIYTGIAQGIQPLFSRYYGKGEKTNIEKTMKYAMYTVIVLSVLIYVGTFLFADSITVLFNSEHSVRLQEIAVVGMRIYFIGGLFAGVNIILSIFFTSTGATKPAGIISILRGFVLIIPLSFLLSKMFQMTGLWSAFPVTEAVVCAGAVWYFVRQKKLRTR